MRHSLLTFSILLFLLSSCTVEQHQDVAKDTPTSMATSPAPSPTPITTPEINQAPTSTPEDDLLSAYLTQQTYALLPEYGEDILNQMGISQYSIHVVVDFDPVQEVATIEGQAHIRYTNSNEDPLNNLVLMLWPNDVQYQAVMEAGPIMIDGQVVNHQVESEGRVLRVALPSKLTSGESVDLSLPFSIRTEGSISNQRKRFGITNGILMAPTFYPLIPRLVNGQWQTDIAPTGGDTTNSDSAYYEVAITIPEGYEIITSGVEVDRQLLRSKHHRVTFVTGPMRDFAFAMGKLEKRTTTVNGVSLNAWLLPWHGEYGDQMLDAAVDQMDLLNDLVGPYPYAEMDIVDSPCAFGGIEYPGLVFICSMEDGYYIDTIVHEIAHQWFYGLIGNDQIYEPWLDESLASYWQVLYYENAEGEERAEYQLNSFRSWVNRPEDQMAPIGLGIEEYRKVGDYYTIVYFKGALFFDALRSTMGDEIFFDFLRTYYQRYRYGFVDSRGFQDVAEQVCQCDLSQLFSNWVYKGGDVLK